MNFTFIMRPCSWYKRRIPDQPKIFEEVKVSNYIHEHDAICLITVRYHGETEYKELTGRVTKNPITGNFSINGINPHGDFILLDVEYDTSNNI